MNALNIYLVACSLAAVGVLLGWLAVNIALLLVIVIMVGVCAVHATWKGGK